mmetsp:Transcript_8914/g.12331  ORF Transcript_8914/g.12331 Transcript_8914/m.12331 type:complete len:255 (+) Transcript_8914:1160-1924(+)
MSVRFIKAGRGSGPSCHCSAAAAFCVTPNPAEAWKLTWAPNLLARSPPDVLSQLSYSHPASSEYTSDMLVVPSTQYPAVSLAPIKSRNRAGASSEGRSSISPSRSKPYTRTTDGSNILLANPIPSGTALFSLRIETRNTPSDGNEIECKSGCARGKSNAGPARIVSEDGILPSSLSILTRMRTRTPRQCSRMASWEGSFTITRVCIVAHGQSATADPSSSLASQRPSNLRALSVEGMNDGVDRNLETKRDWLNR